MCVCECVCGCTKNRCVHRLSDCWSGQLVLCVIPSHILTPTQHIIIAEQRAAVKDTEWGVTFENWVCFFLKKKKKEIGCLAEENAEVKHICHLVSYGLEASRGDVETWRLKGKIMICIQISEFKIGTLMHHEVPFGIPALCNIGVRVYKVHLNASWGPCPCAAQMGQMWYWFEFSPRNDT